MCFLLTTPDFLPIDGDLNGYLSGRSTRTFHTPPSYGAERRERESCWGHLQYTILHPLSFMYSGRYTLTDYIHLLHSFLLCCKPTARRRLWDELPFTVLFPIMKLKYSFHITKCSTECLGETFCHQIKSQITLTSKRRRMRLCWCVRFSPRIAVCNRTLTGPWLKLSSSCSGNGGDTHLC